MVHLDVLTGGDVALAKRDVLLYPRGESVQLLGSHAPQRQLDPNHLHVRLTLSVDPLLEPELRELLPVKLALYVPRRLRIEVIELAPEDGDYVPRYVLEDLGVLERALTGTYPPARFGGHPVSRGAL